MSDDDEEESVEEYLKRLEDALRGIRAPRYNNWAHNIESMKKKAKLRGKK